MNIFHRTFSFLWRKKITLIVILVIGLLALAVYFLLNKPKKELTYTVKKEDLVDTVSVSGNYTTASQTSVPSPAKGVITRLFVSNGDTVKKGSPLFYVESTASDDEKAAAYADYQTAAVALKTAQNTQKSAQSALDKVVDDIHLFQYGNGGFSNVGSANETQTQKTLREQSEADLRSATDALASAQATLNSKQLAYAQTQSTTVNSPAEGTVVNLLKSQGEGVDTASTEPVLIVANLANPALTVSINEVNILRIRQGQSAKITFDALPGLSFSGTVESLDTVGTEKQGVITYGAKIAASGLSSDLKPNMTAQVTIETLRKDGILTVPNIVITEKNGRKFVQQKNGKTVRETEIQTGIKGLTKSEVTGGLSEGDVLVIPD